MLSSIFTVWLAGAYATLMVGAISRGTFLQIDRLVLFICDSQPQWSTNKLLTWVLFMAALHVTFWPLFICSNISKALKED